MATSEEMAGYAAHLHAGTPSSSKGRPVTEVCIFKLLPAFAADHAAAAAEFESNVVANTKPGSPHAVGIRRLAWGFSLDDPGTFVWALDWDRIEDHWDFWQSPAFPPVIGAIVKLFEAGRPLVRHYDFGDRGMLDAGVADVARVMVWDDGVQGREEGRAAGLAREREGSTKAKQFRGGYAVDMDEDTWWCSLLGYDSESEAREDHIELAEGAESHIVQLSYL